jgi:Soluble lytic murein transglycosylase and related regulatory proteins (some contain LysM/invasin domains)
MALLLAVVLAACAFMLASGYIARKLHPTEYSDVVGINADKFGVPRSVIFAVINTESSFNPKAVSSAGAMGLMQLMPETFEWLLSKSGEELSTDALYTPEINIRYGTMLLAALYAEFGRWDTAYAAYNAGLNRVRLWLSNPDFSQDGALTEIPFAETERYVKKVEAAVIEYKRLYDMD